MAAAVAAELPDAAVGRIEGRPQGIFIIDSHRIGAEKPDPAIFRAALEPLCAKAETTLFVGDSLRRDREGARRIGMGFLWIAPREVQAFEVLAAKEPLDHSAIARLDDLAEILDDR